MEFAETLPKQIGNVKLNYEFYPGEDIYSDGAIEDEILEITKNAARIEYPKIIEEEQLAGSLPFVRSSGEYCRLAADYKGYEGA